MINVLEKEITALSWAKSIKTCQLLKLLVKNLIIWILMALYHIHDI